MDSNTEAQPHSHAHKNPPPPAPLTPLTPTAPEHPIDHNLDRLTPPPPSPRSSYDYTPATPTPSSPSKRSSETKSEKTFKRLRVEPSARPSAPPADPPARPTSAARKRTRPHYRSQSLPATLTAKRRSSRPPRGADTPPVTLATLRELDLSEIYRNIRLRHDVVFDSALHFRPNLDGNRGRRKKELAEAYWRNVLSECEGVWAALERGQGLAARTELLPVLFETMRDILLTLVPKGDRREVEEALDPELITQQLTHGVLDFKKLSAWLAQVLKAHCAPMRDGWVEQMVNRISFGVESGRMQSFVDGLKIVFGILEAMKLDVANHQIRTLRPHLVATAVSFEHGYFLDKLEKGRLSLTPARSWFNTAVSNSKTETDPYLIFSRAGTEMLTPSRNVTYPETWIFDVDRLDGLRDDIREATCLKLATVCFRSLTCGSRREFTAEDTKKLQATILAILSEEEGPYRWINGSDAVALHVAQAVNTYNGNTGIPDAKDIDIVQGWFTTHLRHNSPVYLMVEGQIVEEIAKLVLHIMKAWAKTSTGPVMQNADVTGSSVELDSISMRIAYISFFHWRVLGKLYTAGADE